MLRCVDVFAVMADGSRKLSFTGSVETMLTRHWPDAKARPRADQLQAALAKGLVLTLPVIYPSRDAEYVEGIHGLFRPLPKAYVAVGQQ
jgi:hypothetical protein